MKIHKMYIGGDWVGVDTGEELEVLNPYDHSLVGKVALGGAVEMDLAIASAEGAFKELRALPAYKRADFLYAATEAIARRAEDFARTIALEAGKPITDARGEVRRAVKTFQIAAEEATRMGGEVMPLDVMEGAEGRSGIIKRFPVGPVLGISPFNFPLNLVAHKVAPAMAVGAPIVLKPALKTPLTSLLLAEVIDEAKWPRGSFSVVICPDKVTGDAVTDDRVKKVTFTGSAGVGWMIKERATKKRVTLELGGNAGVIVHTDADVEYAAKRCALGAFAYSGQVCISVQRIFVERSVMDAFKESFLKEVDKLILGDPLKEDTFIGPMINEGALESTEKLVKEAVDGGATLLRGGSRKGTIFEPTVLTDTSPGMGVCVEEAFAPLVVLEAYDDFTEAIERINASHFGLQAGVFTSDIKRLFYAFEHLEVGGVVGGDVPTFRVDNMPYGGVKESGFGREGIRFAMEEMCEIKILALNLSK